MKHLEFLIVGLVTIIFVNIVKKKTKGMLNVRLNAVGGFTTGLCIVSDTLPVTA